MQTIHASDDRRNAAEVSESHARFSAPEPATAVQGVPADRAAFRDAFMIGRLVRSADFERVLRTRTRLSSAHFALHHLASTPARPAKALACTRSESSGEVQLSTERRIDHQSSVEDPAGNRPDGVPGEALGQVWLGAVVPKRHARRSVTRTLLKRQIRNAVICRRSSLASGLWVVRLRAPFDRAQFPSAASEAMKRLARAELEDLLASAASRSGGPAVRR